MLLTRDNKIIQFSESSLTKENEIKAVETEYGSELKPSNVGQVLLARRLGAIDGPYALKTSFGKYLSPNTIGSVEARREAVGPSEEWTPALIIDENSPTNCFFSLCSYTGHHLGYYETEKEFFRLRADSINAGPSETFRVRCQRTIRNKQRRMAREEELRARGSYSVLSADMEAEHL